MMSSVEKKTFEHPYLLEVAIEMAVISILAIFIVTNSIIS